MNELLVKDRIDELMKALNLSQADFARRVGVTPNAITNWKTRGIKGSAFEKIANAFPNVNMNWLKTGEGDILLERMEKVRPHIPVEVAAGTLSGFSEVVKAGDCEMLPVVSAFPSYDYTMTIKGDSMEPKFESGDMIAIRKTMDFIEWGKTYPSGLLQPMTLTSVKEPSVCISVTLGLNTSRHDIWRRTSVRLTWPLIVWLNMWQVAVDTAISCLEAVRIV